MTRPDLRSEDRRRELALWVFVSADMCGLDAREALANIERAFVGAVAAPTTREASPWYRIERFEDYLPEEGEWEELKPRLERAAAYLDEHRAEIDSVITSASPRWRLDRMPAIDRGLLRLGVTEMRYTGKPHPRATINGLIELAKRLGSNTTPAFVNGILDQIRRDLSIPFQ